MSSNFEENRSLKELHQLIDQMSQIEKQNSSKKSLLQYYLQHVQQKSPDLYDEIQDEKGIINISDQSAKLAFVDLFEKLQLLQAEYDKLEGVKIDSMTKSPSNIPKGIRQILKISNSVIMIQAWWRKILALKNMQKSLHTLRCANPEKYQNLSPEEQSIREFVTQLKAKKLTPESFFRICDSDYSQRVTVAFFKEHLQSLNVQLSKAQMSRLIMILDEDIEGIVTLEEFNNALEAYGVSGEKHKPLDGSILHHTFQQKCLFKMILALQRKDITYIEVFNACDINDDQLVTLNELRNFIQGLSSDFKVKEIHALIDYLDIDNNGILTKEGFIKQLSKGEQLMRQTITLNKQIADKRVQNKAQQNNFMFSQESFRQSNLNQSPQKDDQDESFSRFEIEEAGEGDQAIMVPPPQQTLRNIKQNQPLKASANSSLKKLPNPNNLTSDEVKRQQIIQQMEREGINHQNFVSNLKRQVVNGQVSLGNLLKLFDAAYTSISKQDRDFLIKDCVRERTKIDFFLFDNLLSKYSMNIQPSVTQFFQTVAQKILKQMGSSPLDSLRQFFKSQNLNDLNTISEITFYQIFQKVAPQSVPQSVFNQAFQVLPRDSDDFAIVQDIIQVLVTYVSFAGTKLSLTLASDELKKIIPDFELISPRTRCERLVKYFAKEMAAKSIKAVSVYKMADPNNNGIVTATVLEATFKKIFPQIKLEIIQELMEAFKGTKNSENIRREDFEAVFNDEQLIGKMTTATISKSPLPASSKEEKKIERKPDDKIDKWIKMLEDAFIKEGVTPAVAFKSADINKDGSISSDELRETIKRIIPEESLNHLQVLKIVNAFDTDRNTVISEQEFIAKFQKLHNTTSINPADTSSQVPFRDTKGPQVKDQQDAKVPQNSSNMNAPKITQIPEQNKVPPKQQPEIFNQNGQKPKQEEISAGVKEKVDPNILVKALEQQIGQPLEQALKDIFKDEIIGVLSFNKLLRPSSGTVDKNNLSNLGKLISPLNTSGNLKIKEIIDFLKTIPGKYNKEQVIKEIANDIFDPVIKTLDEQGLTSPTFYPKQDYLEIVQSLSKISNFKAVGLFYDLSEDQDTLQGKIFIQAIQAVKPPIPAKGPEKDMISKSVVEPKIEQTTQPVLEPKCDSVSQNILPLHTYSPYDDAFQISQENNLKKFVDALKANMLDNNIREAFIKLFESSSNQEIQIDEFAAHIYQKWKNAQIQDEDITLFEKNVDLKSVGRLRLSDVVDFCNNHNINLDYKGVLKKIQDDRRESLPGQELTCGKLTYKIVPELDYYNGIPTILTSEEAALVVCNKIFNDLPDKPVKKEFFDLDFGPKNDDDIQGSIDAMFFPDEQTRPTNPIPEEVQWLKPEQFCPDKKFEFINQGASANDVRQGLLGDCWFISALCVLAARDELIRGGVGSIDIQKDQVVDKEFAMKCSNGVYPSIFHVYRYKGIFVFRFFKNFKWLYVIIDDRIPTIEGGDNYTRKPAFGHCTDPGEVWVPLIEKAYAKLHGCYQALTSGCIHEGLAELTGFVPEKISMHQGNQFPAIQLGTIDDFWDFLKKRKAEKCLMGCSRPTEPGETNEQYIWPEDDEEITGVPYGQNCGIMKGHAYGLMDAFEIQDQQMKNLRKTHRILIVRNPHGHTEWSGKWGYQSIEMETFSEQIDQYIQSIADEDEKFDPAKDDGTFLINYRNWRTIFNQMFVCIDFPVNWDCVRYHSQWDDKCSGGFPIKLKGQVNNYVWEQNPQYCIENNHPGEMEIFIYLSRQDNRGTYDKNGKPVKFPFIETISHITFSVIHASFSNPKAPPKLIQKYEEKITKQSPISNHQAVSMRVTMPQGYIYIVPSTIKQGQTGEFILSIYFNKPKTKIHFHRLDRPSENNFKGIKEESQNANSVPEWKVLKCQQLINHMIGEEDNENEAKIQLKNAAGEMKLQSKKPHTNLKDNPDQVVRGRTKRTVTRPQK